MNVTAPFDLVQVSNELIGDIWLLGIIGFVVVCYFSLKNKLPLPVTSILLVVFGAIIFVANKDPVLWTFLLLIAALSFYYQISKVIRKG